MYRNYKSPFRFCVKRFGRVLGPLSSGSASLGAPFLGSGQPVDDKGGARWAKKGVFDATSWRIGVLLRRCAVGGGETGGDGGAGTTWLRCFRLCIDFYEAIDWCWVVNRVEQHIHVFHYL